MNTLKQKKHASKLLLASALLVPVVASANDITVDAASINGLLTPVSIVGGAIMAVLIAIKGWKLIRRAL